MLEGARWKENFQEGHTVVIDTSTASPSLTSQQSSLLKQNTAMLAKLQAKKAYNYGPILHLFATCTVVGTYNDHLSHDLFSLITNCACA